MRDLKGLFEKTEEAMDETIQEWIEEANAQSTKVTSLGFTDGGTGTQGIHMHKGFIPLNTRIKYDTYSMATYSMQTTDFIYEYAHFLKDKGIDNARDFIMYLESFINDYFGSPGQANRNDILDTIHYKNTQTEDEYFDAIEHNQLGDLKGKGAAMCTERSALAQQVLSVFGFESYFCMGCIEHGGKQEAHCFNVVERKNNYAILDYSLPVKNHFEKSEEDVYYPFVVFLSPEEFDAFMNHGAVKNEREYEIDENNQKRYLPGVRRYVAGRFEIEKTSKQEEIEK